MNIRCAILKAADHIESNPQLSTDVPSKPSELGCAIGWIGHFAGIRERWWLRTIGFTRTLRKLGFSDGGDDSFYDRMNYLGGFGWVCDDKLCVKALRAYADTYHPEVPELQMYAEAA